MGGRKHEKNLFLLTYNSEVVRRLTKLDPPMNGQNGDNWTTQEDKLVRKFLFLLSTVCSAQHRWSSQEGCLVICHTQLAILHCWVAILLAVQKRGGVECLVLGCNHNWRLPSCELPDPLRYTSSHLWKNIHFEKKSKTHMTREKNLNCAAVGFSFILTTNKKKLLWPNKHTLNSYVTKVLAYITQFKWSMIWQNMAALPSWPTMPDQPTYLPHLHICHLCWKHFK